MRRMPKGALNRTFERVLVEWTHVIGSRSPAVKRRTGALVQAAEQSTEIHTTPQSW